MSDKTAVASDAAEDLKKSLQSSPLRGIQPVQPCAIEVDIDSIEIDPTNPGTVTKSRRNDRRMPSMNDSIDIIGGVVYPGVVCQKKGEPGKYVHVDCYGRLHTLKARGFKKMWVIVYPPLSQEQIICLRQVLNAAMEPFDAVSVIADLRLLADERGLDLTSLSDVRMLVRDMPAKVRKFEKDIVMLGRWDAKTISNLGDSQDEGETIGLDKIRAMTSIINTVSSCHPKTLTQLGGEKKLSKILGKMFLDGKFSEDTRSQEGIRVLNRALKNITEDHEKVHAFFDQQKPWNALGNGGPVTPNLQKLCAAMIEAVVLLDFATLSAKDKRALEGTVTVLQQFVGSPVICADSKA